MRVINSPYRQSHGISPPIYTTPFSSNHDFPIIFHRSQYLLLQACDSLSSIETPILTSLPATIPLLSTSLAANTVKEGFRGAVGSVRVGSKCFFAYDNLLHEQQVYRVTPTANINHRILCSVHFGLTRLRFLEKFPNLNPIHGIKSLRWVDRKVVFGFAS